MGSSSKSCRPRRRPVAQDHSARRPGSNLADGQGWPAAGALATTRHGGPIDGPPTSHLAKNLASDLDKSYWSGAPRPDIALCCGR